MRPKVDVLTAQSLLRVFVLYEHRLVSDILGKLLGEHIVGSLDRSAAPLGTIVEAINRAKPSVVIIESDANGNTAWHLLLAGAGTHRMILLDVEKGTLQEYETRTIPIETLEELRRIISRQHRPGG